MNPFVVSEAVRRVRHRSGRAHARRSPLWRLLAGEVVHLVRSPATAVVASGLAVAVGVHVALGTAYPGPVAPGVVRWAFGAAVVVAVVGLARTTPSSWGEVARSLRAARAVVAATCLAGVVSLVKVGLHDTTPGPALPAPGRWGAVLVAAVLLAVVLGRGAARR